MCAFISENLRKTPRLVTLVVTTRVTLEQSGTDWSGNFVRDRPDQSLHHFVVASSDRGHVSWADSETVLLRLNVPRAFLVPATSAPYFLLWAATSSKFSWALMAKRYSLYLMKRQSRIQ